MSKEEILQHEYIWGFMYGKPTIHVYHWNGPDEYEQDVLVRIPTKSLRIYDDDMIYIWGWPGPDFNTYLFDGYKKTWCFDPSEMPWAKVHESDKKYLNAELAERSKAPVC